MTYRKIVLSRKGFDSRYGKVPSPILDDGTLVPLPIPGAHDSFQYRDIDAPIDLDKFLRDCSTAKQPLDGSSNVHLDPDLARKPELRSPGWRPSLGQSGIAQRHLAKQNVGVGDIFLFFGWFRQVQFKNDLWSYVRGAPDLHVIFGWLEVADVLPVVTDRENTLQKYPWLIDHPHLSQSAHYSSPLNHIYIGAENSEFFNGQLGGGVFKSHRQELQLTTSGRSRTWWTLPAWLHPENRVATLSYHGKPESWSLNDDSCMLKSADIGQEFVLNCSATSDVDRWLKSILGLTKP